MANKISVVIDVAVDRANAALGNFRKAVADAEGATGKFKAGAGAALDSVKANAANLALAGGTALVAFAAKGVSEFNKLAIESGKMSEALGIPVEDMSRLIEVAGDLGIETSALESTIGRMNRTAASTPEAFASINAQIVKNADGTTNVNETFLATVDALRRIPDATKRAQAAQKIFGRSWQDIAELVGKGSEEIRKSLEAVSDQKIIDESEVEQAREYRAAMDELNDAIQDISLAAGQVLTPILSDAADIISRLTSGVGEADDATGGWAGKLAGLGNVFGVTRDLWDKGPGSLIAMASATDDAAESTAGLGGSMVQASIDAALLERKSADLAQAQEDNAQAYIDHARGMQREASETAAANEAATARIEAAWDRMNEQLSDRSAYLDIQDALADVETSYMTAMDTADKSLAEQEADARNLERSVMDLKGKVNLYAEEIALLPPEMATEFQALIDEGAYAEVERRLGVLERIRIALITPYVNRAYGGVPDQTPGAKFHSGGVVGVGNFASDEVPAVLQKGEMVLTEGQQAAVASRMAGGTSGGTTNVTINVNGGDPNTVVAALRKYVRTNGPITGIT